MVCFDENNRIRTTVEKKFNTDLIDDLNKHTECSNAVKKNKM